MRYLIDGYNFLHKLLAPPKRLPPRQFEQRRKEMLDYLVEYLGSTANGVTVVLDKRCVRSPNGQTDYYHGLTLVLVGNADDYIISAVQGESAPHLLGVVSDDRLIREAAERRDCRLFSCEGYIDHLNQIKASQQRRHTEPDPALAQLPAAPPEKPTTPTAEDEALAKELAHDIESLQQGLTRPLRSRRPR